MALEASLRDRIDLVIQKPDKQFLAIAHMHIASPGQATRSFSKRALDASFAKLLSEHRESLIQTGFYRTQRAVQQISDFLECKPVVLLENDGRPLLFRQLRHGFTHGTPDLVPGHELLDRFRRR